VDEDLSAGASAAVAPLAVGRGVAVAVSDSEFAATLGGEVSSGVDVEAEEARRALHDALRKTSKKAAAAPTPAAAAATPTSTTAGSAAAKPAGGVYVPPA
jgi:hypothetical protein